MQHGIVVINTANKFGVNGEIVDVYDGPTPTNALAARVGRFMSRFPSRVSQHPVSIQSASTQRLVSIIEEQLSDCCTRDVQEQHKTARTAILPFQLVSSVLQWPEERDHLSFTFAHMRSPVT